MTKPTPLPSAVQRLLPESDRQALFVTTDGGNFLVAGNHALILTSSTQVLEAGMWYEVQYAKWDADTRRLTVVWIDPDRPVTRLVTVEENPAAFMRQLTSQVDRTIVLSRQVTTVSGGAIIASVRRRVDGELFSTVVIRGRTTAGERAAADDLERQVRAEVDLDS